MKSKKNKKNAVNKDVKKDVKVAVVKKKICLKLDYINIMMN